MGEARIKELHRKMTNVIPIEKPYPKFIQFGMHASGAWFALDELGGVWTRYAVKDGSQDRLGNERVVWVPMDDERCRLEVSPLVDPKGFVS